MTLSRRARRVHGVAFTGPFESPLYVFLIPHGSPSGPHGFRLVGFIFWNNYDAGLRIY
jgi:hypothetical protein